MVGDLSAFPQVCGRVRSLGASCLWCLPDKYAQVEFDDIARTRVMPVGDEAEWTYADLLLPAHKDRQLGYEKLAEESKAKGLSKSEP